MHLTFGARILFDDRYRLRAGATGACCIAGDGDGGPTIGPPPLED